MVLTKIPGSLIVDDAITSAKITDTTITNAKMALDPSNASNLSSGDVPLAQLGNVPDPDLTAQKGDIALLAFKTQANGNLAKYNLVDQTVDAFEDATGIDASASTGETRSSGNYYSGAAGVDATGGTITKVGGNTIHTFGVGNTNFVVPGSANVSWLVVGGGGGAGYDAGGGGGAGGFRAGASHAVTAQTYTVVVGAGGAGSSSGAANGTNGSDSSFDTVTSNGGGGGGTGGAGFIGSSGGSGGGSRMRSAQSGGAGNTPSITPITGETTTVQGYAGGGHDGVGGSNNTSGGGGGSSAVGVDGAASQSSGTYGNGGAGTVSTITGSSVTYAGGGGGAGEGTGRAGSGGSGGGGNGANGSGAVDGVDGTGGGGGGGGGTPGDGGNGVVVISYSDASFATYTNMTLVSNSVTAEAQPTKADVVLTYTNGAGTATINTDLITSVSRDNGTTYTPVTLASQGTTGGHTILTANNVDISGQPAGTSMRWKVATINQSASKDTRIHAVSLGWS
tara:strand:+ start:146 stop:1666 length:1521 start_codon:yes stop_codon:yes gene_type:complete